MSTTWLPAKDRNGFQVEYRKEGSRVAVKDKSGKITTISAETFFDDYFAEQPNPRNPMESTGMSRLGSLVEGSTIKKRTTTWPDGTVQVDEDLTWEDEPKAKKESALLSRIGRLLEAEAYATITINGNKLFVKPFDDGIHLSFSKDGKKWGIPNHIAQLQQHPSGEYTSIEGIKAAGRALEKWLANPVVKDLGVFGS